jgi:hypothetical protein
MRLVPGRDFGAGDVEKDADRTIHVHGVAGGIIVGGMSYELDPKLTHPQDHDHDHDHEPGDDCLHSAAELVRCLDLESRRVRRTVIRRVTLDIDFEEPCP